MWIATGLGFGARAGHPIVGALLKDYEDIPFIKEDGRLDTESCPGRNTRTLRTFGLRLDNTKQEIDGIVFLPTQYLAPVSYFHRKKEITEHTVSIHHYDGSWLTKRNKKPSVRRLLGTDCIIVCSVCGIKSIRGKSIPKSADGFYEMENSILSGLFTVVQIV